MADVIQTPRSDITGWRPPAGEREPGQLYTNHADRQLGVVNEEGVPIDLLAVRLFSEAADYAAGALVARNTRLYRSRHAITAGAWDQADWDSIDGPAVYLSATAPAATFDGQLWLDLSENPPALKVYQATLTRWVAAYRTVLIGDDEPLDPPLGTLWYNTGLDRLWVWSGEDWVDTSGSSISVSETAPVGVANGELWFNPNAMRLFVRQGDAWHDVAPNEILVDSVPPVNPLVGRLWHNTLSGRTFVWRNNAWHDVAPAQVKSGTTAPVAPAEGDLWLDTGAPAADFSAGATLRIRQGSSWERVVQPQRIKIAVGAVPPADPLPGMLWYENEIDGRVFIWDGEFWVDAAPAAPSELPEDIPGVLYNDGSGTLTWEDPAILFASDLRQKASFGALPVGLTELMQLTARSYEWQPNLRIARPAGVHYGLLAQELEEVLPEAVRTLRPGAANEVKTIEPMALVAVLIQAVQELTQRVQDLEG